MKDFSPFRPAFRSVTVIVCAAALAAGVPVRAQEDLAFVSPRMPDDPNLSRVTMFRLWYPAGPPAPPVALVREPQGQKAVFLEGGLQPGLFSPYVPLKPGRFTMHVLDGSVTAASEPLDRSMLEEKKLAEPVEVDFLPGTFLTLVIENREGKLAARFLRDRRPPEAGPPVMQVKDFSGLGGWRIQLLDRNMKPLTRLWSSDTPSESVELPDAGIFRIQVTRPVGGAAWQLGLFEAKLNRGSAFSIILGPGGHDGHGVCGLSFDAVPGSHDPARIKTVADHGP